jgi:hypothetical protein
MNEIFYRYHNIHILEIFESFQWNFQGFHSNESSVLLEFFLSYKKGETSLNNPFIDPLHLEQETIFLNFLLETLNQRDSSSLI